MTTNKEKKSWRFNLDITPEEKNQLQILIQQELTLYNLLVEKLGKILRKNPKSFLSMKKKIGLFGNLVEYNLDVEQQILNPNEQLKPYKDMMSFLNNDEINILKCAKSPGVIASKTRRNMGVEILKYCIDQADLMSKGSGGALLHQYDLNQKRHLQLQRRSIKTHLNETEDGVFTNITVPYLKSSIILAGDYKFKRWDMIIIHQKPGILATTNTPWCFDLRKTDFDYLLTYLDYSEIKSNSFEQDKHGYKKVLL